MKRRRTKYKPIEYQTESFRIRIRAKTCLIIQGDNRIKIGFKDAYKLSRLLDNSLAMALKRKRLKKLYHKMKGRKDENI